MLQAMTNDARQPVVGVNRVGAAVASKVSRDTIAKLIEDLRQVFFRKIKWAGIDKICWGTDFGGNVDEVEFLEKFQISEEVQRDYGYAPLSEEDRAKWAGLNLARILKITPKA